MLLNHTIIICRQKFHIFGSRIYSKVIPFQFKIKKGLNKRIFPIYVMYNPLDKNSLALTRTHLPSVEITPLFTIPHLVGVRWKHFFNYGNPGVKMETFFHYGNPGVKSGKIKSKDLINFHVKFFD